MNKKIIIPTIVILVIIVVIAGFFIYNNKSNQNPEEILSKYIELANEKKYEEMYDLISDESKESVTKEEFISRNKNIYEGIDMKNMSIEINNIEKVGNNESKISYTLKMDTIAGNVEFQNVAKLLKNEEKNYKINWSSNFIFLGLNSDDKVKVKTENAKRGNIIDRNGELLAGEGKVSSVGLVPGKMSTNKEENIEKIANLLEVSVNSINSQLGASYVKDDTFVAIKKISSDNQTLKDELLQIPGVKITTSTSRVYPFAEATSHLTGYVQSITEEELKENSDKGYTSNSLIGKTGLEKQYEDRLRGTNGVEIYIEDSNGNKKSTIAKKEVQNGENIKITIDSALQEKLYNELKNDEGFFVVMQPRTGEILALVSTPSYNSNDFVLGMSNDKWSNLKSNEAKPMYNRFSQSWCPGSTFKPITGAIGLTTNSLSTNDEFNYDGLSWQKDSSWGEFRITTLTAYNGTKNLKNALIHSDNIYFARVALKIGNKTFEEQLKKIGFDENLEFELPIQKSTFANDGSIDTEIGLADSGYGQGQILVNPIHMAAVYSAFANDGNMVKPYLEYKDNKEAEYLVRGAFTKESAETIKENLIQVVENPEGTANDMRVNGVTIAGKTGTAELKQSKEDKEGETLGWFNCFTADEDYNNQLLIVSMVENAKSNGGSHYLIKKIKTLF